MTDDDLSPEDRERFDSLSPAELAQLPVNSAAFDFLNAAVLNGDIPTAWPIVDPLFRTCWVQHWLAPILADVRRDGFDPDDVAQALSVEQPDHPLWPHFCRVQASAMRQLPYDPETWGIGTGTRLVAPDIELVLLHDTLEDLQPNTSRPAYPLLMHYSDHGWRVLNFGSEEVPTPGWPPQL